jgi:type IV pilus assembly protein PilY1
LAGYTLALATGEKGVNAPVTTRGTTFFGTNRPTPPAANSCGANLGEARGYAINPFTGAFDFTTFEGGGLPPTATTGIVAISWLNTATNQVTEVRRQFCVGCGAAVPPGSGTTPGRSGADRTSALGAGDLSVSVPKNPRRTYWFTR